MIRKGLVIGIIILFVGASLTPTISGDDQFPVTTVEFGAPQIIQEWQGSNYYVIGPNTPVWINSSDVLPGSERIEYSVWVADDLEDPITWTFLWTETVYDGDDDDLDETYGSIVTKFYNDENCLHEVRYQCWDYDGATEGFFTIDFFVDKCGPITTLVVEGPICDADWPPPPWINGITSLNFNSVDDCCLPDGTIVEKITIKVWWKSNPYDSSGAFILIDTIVVEDGDENDINPDEGKVGYELHLEETGFYILEYWGVDMMGNIESHHKQQYRVDVVPPEIIKTVGEPSYQLPGSDDYYVTTGTEIILEANDFGCGYYGALMIVYKIKYDDYWTDWIWYTGPLYFDQEGEYILAVRAYDCLGNVMDEEYWDVETFYVYDTLPTIIDDVWLNVPFFSQLDDSWKDKPYDHIYPPYTIKDMGCALTCAAMLSVYYGYETNPDELNTALINTEGGYNTDGGLNWIKLNEVSNNKVNFSGFSGGGFTKIQNELSQGYPVIAWVSSSTYSSHFIIFIGYIGDSYYFLDPADKSRENNMWPDGAHGEYSFSGDQPLRILRGTPTNMKGADLDSPGELRVYDSSNRITGLIDGIVFEEIPDSFYDAIPESVTIYYPEDNYYYKIVGIEEDNYNLTIFSIDNGNKILFLSFEIPIVKNAIHEYFVDWDALSEGEEGVIMQIDYDGDGIFERTIISDANLTQEEFILQTETIVDIDPDTLNQNSSGKWITCYIELPEGYNVSNISTDTILLNDIINAEITPINISDYDEDSILDIMVKFDRQDVINILEYGDNVEIKITGELIDGTRFEGVDYIKVI